MSSIVYLTNKKSGTKYAYESVSYYDKEKKQPRNKRRLLGIVDPASGEIVPTSRQKNLQKAEETSDYKTLYENQKRLYESLSGQMKILEQKLDNAFAESKMLSSKLQNAVKILTQ